MSNGRAAAQCAHVAAKVVELGYGNISGMTTIILAAASTNHLYQITDALNRMVIGWVPQVDTLDEGQETTLQAIATLPVTKKQSEIFQFCEMW